MVLQVPFRLFQTDRYPYMLGWTRGLRELFGFLCVDLIFSLSAFVKTVTGCHPEAQAEGSRLCNSLKTRDASLALMTTPCPDMALMAHDHFPNRVFKLF